MRNLFESAFSKGGVHRNDEKILAELLKDYSREDAIPFHMPGHKRSEQYEYLMGAQALDITEINGFDNLHDAQGVLAESMRRAADLFGAKHTRFLVNGSTCGILAAISCAASRGDSVLIARNCHKSVFNAVELNCLKPEYVLPSYFEEFGFWGSVSPESVREAFDKNPDIKLAVITSPTYEGIISDVKSIADICHAHGALLIVDEAHGAHLGISKKFAQSARRLGADIIVNSLHKTLPSLTQTALLHVCGDRVDIERLDEKLAVYESSSPSYVLMASIDGCVRYLEANGAQMAAEWDCELDRLRKSLGSLCKLHLFGGSDLKDGRVFAYDKSKLVFVTSDTDISGVELAKLLRVRGGIVVEMAGANYVIAMTGAGDKKSAYFALADTLNAIDCEVDALNGLSAVRQPVLPKKSVQPYEIDLLNTEFVDFEKSIGRVCAEYVWAYPPGCPVIAKGETIGADFVKYAMQLYELGIDMHSTCKRFPKSIKTVVGGQSDLLI